MLPIAGVDIVLSNLQNTSRTISLHTVKYEAICDILHQMSAIVSLPANIPLHSIICHTCVTSSLCLISKDIKSWWQARALPFRAVKCKLGLGRAGRSVFLHPQTSAHPVQHRRRHSRQLYWKCYILAGPCSCSEKLCAPTFSCHSVEPKVPHSWVRCNYCLLQCCTSLQSRTRKHLPELEGFPMAESWQSSFHTPC